MATETLTTTTTTVTKAGERVVFPYSQGQPLGNYQASGAVLRVGGVILPIGVSVSFEASGAVVRPAASCEIPAGALTLQVVYSSAPGQLEDITAVRQRRQMVTRLVYPNGTTLSDGTQTTFLQKVPVIAAPQADWSDLLVKFCNFGINYDDGPNSITYRASIEYNGGRTPLYSPSGSRDIVVEPGAVVAASAPITIPAGTEFYIWVLGTVAAAGKWAQSDVNFYGANGGFESPGTDKTLSGTITAPGTNKVVPCILGVTGVPSVGSFVPSVAILGDSISAGAGEASTTVERGFIVRALQNEYAWLHLGQSGQNTSALVGATGVSNGRFRRRAWGLDGITHVLDNNGTNDIGTSVNNTAEQLIASKILLNADLKRRGIKHIIMTLMPRTDTGNTGGFYNTDTQTQRDRIATYNAWVRTNPLGDGYFDAHAFAADPSDPTRWRSDLGNPTNDGLHPNPSVHAPVGAGLKAQLPALLAA